MPRISVIVPIYNNEIYFRACIDSIRVQSYANLEILLIDDGSTDACGEICDAYAAEDARIRVFHQAHAGVSAARNTGIDAACGDYLMFVDSDDTVHPQMAEKMLTLIEKHSAQIASCVTKYLLWSGETSNYLPFEEFSCTGREALKLALMSSRMNVSACNKLFLRSAVSTQRFPTDVSYGEDAVYVMNCLPRVQTVAVTSEELYNYRNNPNSAMKGRFRDNCLELIDIYTAQEAVIREKYPEALDGLHYRIDCAHFYVLEKLTECGYPCSDPRFIRSGCWIRRRIFSILKSPFFSSRRKIGACMLTVSSTLYRNFFKKTAEYLKSDNRLI